jgi:hypothetical protein
MVAPVYAYNPMKIPPIWHQSDWKFMIFHSVYDFDGLGRKNKKGPKYVLMRLLLSFFGNLNVPGNLRDTGAFHQ